MSESITFSSARGRIYTAISEADAPCPITDEGPFRLFTFHSDKISPCDNLGRDANAVLDMIAETDLGDQLPYGFKTWSCRKKAIWLAGHLAITEVYYLEHSDFKYSAYPFNDVWDSGVIGFAWCPLNELRTLTGFTDPAHTLDKIQPTIQMFCQHHLPRLIETYDAWAHGDIWRVEDFNGDVVSYVYASDLDEMAASIGTMVNDFVTVIAPEQV